MKKSDFYFNLPKELIAQTPLDQRDQSKMMHINKNTGAVEHRHWPRYSVRSAIFSVDDLTCGT